MTPSPINAIRAMKERIRRVSLSRQIGYRRAMAPRAHPTALPISLDDIRAAAERIKGAVIRTPTMLSRTLSNLTGATIYVKFENLQFTAAYKERGALNKLLLMDEAT